MKNNTLLGFLFLLAIVVAFVFWKEANTEIRNFKKDILNINVASVNKILIEPKSFKPETIELIKKDSLWFVNNLDSGLIKANQNLLKSIEDILDFTAERTAATTKEKWQQYLVDEISATKIEIFESNLNHSIFYLGKFSYSQETGAVTSYVRIPNDDNTYAIKGQHSLIFDQNTQGFISEEN